VIGPGIVHRLLEEVAIAGVTQAIVVSACAPVTEPHHLPLSRLDARHRAGEFIAAPRPPRCGCARNGAPAL
jgi:hypothetical protein